MKADVKPIGRVLGVDIGGTKVAVGLVDREGTMTGANLEWFRSLRNATSHPIIAAGGIKTHREIAALEQISMDAAVGMALYKNRLR